jgi:FkbM family methyltransferase
MSRKNVSQILTGAYSLAQSSKLLETPWAKRAFSTSYFLYKRFWEDPFWGLVQRMPELFQRGDILDVGANIGYTSCVFAAALTSESKVYAFEPDPANFQMLQDVISRRNLSHKIVAINAAVGSSDERVELWHNKNHSGDHRVATRHFKASFTAGAQTSTVSMTSVDSFVRARNPQGISFIKMDVQGYELAVCEGMRQTMAQFPEMSICCEYSPQSLIELGFDPLKLLDFFRSSGYVVHVVSRRSIQSVPDDGIVQRIADKAGYVDLLCSKRVLD